MNRFRFMNVGQGLFYHGKIGDFNFVYDCGSLSLHANQYLTNCIMTEFVPKEEINYVFLSHLDEDHINGYKILNKYANIKHVVLPYLGNNPLFIYLFLGILCDDDTELFEKLYGEYLEQYNLEEIRENDGVVRNRIGNFILGDHFWTFNCFSKFVSPATVNNFTNHVVTMIAKTFKLSGQIDEITIKKYIDTFGFRKLKPIYRFFFKGMNVTSMCLIHHPSCDLDNITLLTGDAEFDNGMINYVVSYIGNNLIRYFQVPHHGAKKEWNMLNGLKNKCINFYISFGLGNKYTHPSSVVINDITAMNKVPHLCYQFNSPFFYHNEYTI